MGILNKNFVIEYLAGKGLENFDTKPDDFLGKTIYDANPFKTRPPKSKRFAKTTLKGETGFLEIRYNDQYFELHTAPSRASDENEPKILYLAQEVTENRKNRLMLDTALQAANLVVFEYNFQDDLLKGNDTLRELFELDSREAHPTTRTFEQKVHPEDRKNTGITN